jgi:intracellular sulfur oxidation DsrE/DsrF family protein
MPILSKSATWLSALVCLALSSQLWAAPAAKPFAEKKVVLQVSDDDASKQTLVLNVASNLIKHYGPNRVDVEIVAFGSGLRLLFADNSNAALVDAGVVRILELVSDGYVLIKP